MPIRPAHQPRAAHDVTHGMRRVLRLVISLLLVCCTPPALDQCAKKAALSLEQGAPMAYSVIMEPATVSVDHGQRINQKSPPKAFQHAALPNRAPQTPPLAPAFVPFYIIDRFANAIGLKAVALRAPPSL